MASTDQFPPSPPPSSSSEPSLKEDIFVIKPPEKKPLDRKSVTITSILALIGVIVGIILFICILVFLANQKAQEYKVQAYKNLKAVDRSLYSIEPGAVLNNRELPPSFKTLTNAKQSQPELVNVLFVEKLSQEYQQTAALEKQIMNHYEKIDTYILHIQQLLAFDATLINIKQQEKELTSRVATADSLALRSVAGSLKAYAQKITTLESPPQLTAVQRKIGQSYLKKASLYEVWATAVDTNDQAQIAATVGSLSEKKLQVENIVNDTVYQQAFTESYKDLQETHRALERQLL
jgi:uncharacterized membrane protein YvbJ